MRMLDCNENSMRYWSTTGYTDNDLYDFLNYYDSIRLTALVKFRPGQEPEIAISKKTWQSQSGHYFTIANFFKSLVLDQIGAQLSGSIIVWLDDGVYPYESHHLSRAPILTFSRSIYDHHSFLMPDPAFIGSFGYSAELAKQIELENKISFLERIPVMFWRGAASGLHFTESGWKVTHRGALVLKAKEISKAEVVDAAFSKIEGWSEETTKSIIQAGVVKNTVPFEEFLKFRYLIDCDGITCAWISLFRKLASGSVVVKMLGENIQWYYHQLKPWEHFVPMRGDAEDLEMVHTWLLSHPGQCQSIINNAHNFIKTINFSEETKAVILLIKEILKLKKTA